MSKDEKPACPWGARPGEPPEPCWFEGCDQNQTVAGCPTHGIS